MSAIQIANFGHSEPLLSNYHYGLIEHAITHVGKGVFDHDPPPVAIMGMLAIDGWPSMHSAHRFRQASSRIPDKHPNDRHSLILQGLLSLGKFELTLAPLDDHPFDLFTSRESAVNIPGLTPGA